MCPGALCATMKAKKNFGGRIMKKLLMIVAVICLIACVLSLLLSALSWNGYYNVMDGSPELYIRLKQRMLYCLIVGIVLAAAGAASLYFRTKL